MKREKQKQNDESHRLRVLCLIPLIKLSLPPTVPLPTPCRYVHTI